MQVAFLPLAGPAGGISPLLHCRQACTSAGLQVALSTSKRVTSSRRASGHGLATFTATAAVTAAAASLRACRRGARGRRVLHTGAGSLGGQQAPAVIFGGGRVGEALLKMGAGGIVVKRGEPFPASAPPGPIYVCTRNDSLSDVISITPKERREDLIFIQNGALLPFLEKELGKDVPFTVLLVYFAVAKKGDPPLDGKTDTDPDGLSAVNAAGKWAKEVESRLTGSNLACNVLGEPAFTKAYWEKNLWIAAYMLVGALHEGCKVGDVESEHRGEVDSLIGELASALSKFYPELEWDHSVLCDRLAAYARSVAHFPTAVKEFEWRNGAFYDLSLKALQAGDPDPCPLHTQGLKTVGALPS